MRRRALLAASMQSGGGGGWGDLITFKIAADMMGRNYITYNAYDGMTWYDWIKSEFNVDKYYIDDNDLIYSSLTIFPMNVINSSGGAVYKTDYIEAGNRYDIG